MTERYENAGTDLKVCNANASGWTVVVFHTHASAVLKSFSMKSLHSPQIMGTSTLFWVFFI